MFQSLVLPIFYIIDHWLPGVKRRFLNRSMANWKGCESHPEMRAVVEAWNTCNR